MRLKKVVVVLGIAVALSGCATTVPSKDALIASAQLSPSEKECYSYDTLGRANARNLPTSAGLGIIGGLFPPLLIVTAIASGVSAAADQAALPVKCGLTVDDAVREAWMSSFNEDATAIWSQKNGPISIMVKPVVRHGRCSVHEVKVGSSKGGLKEFVQIQEICKDSEGVPYIEAATVKPERVEEMRTLASAQAAPANSQPVRLQGAAPPSF